MKICAIQQPYSYRASEAAASVDFLIKELESCDPSLDLILTPEYSNCPSSFPAGESLPFAIAHTAELETAAIAAARRCNAIVALSYCAPCGNVYRNTTRVFAPDGSVAGEYCKQQLLPKEPQSRQVDNSYALTWRPPAIVEVGGLRLGFVTCYDAYFEEYIEHLAYRHPDIVLVASHQRGEPCDNLRLLNRMLAFHTNAFVLRASVGMGPEVDTGGTSLVVAPDGTILADSGQRNGRLSCEIGDPHRKYNRTNGFGGKPISNDAFIEQGRTPWSYRPAGSCVKLGERQMPYPRVCAHRGFSSIAPENSMPAFGAAIALGADEIEFDLWESADGVPVSIHDASLACVSNGSGHVRDKTLAELRELDFGVFGGLHSASFAGLRVVTLEDILRRFPRQAVMNVHIKSYEDEHFSRAFLRKVIGLFEEYDCAGHAYLMARGCVMEAALEVAPWFPRCMAAGNQRMNIVDDAIRWKCRKVQFFKPDFNKEMIERAHAHGMRCNLFWSDDPDETRNALEMGIDTILTNDYWRIAQVRDAFLADKAAKNI